MAARGVLVLLGAIMAAGSRLDEYLLPRNLVPSHYDLRLVPYLDGGNFTFDGEVTIRVAVANETNIVRLHQNDTTIDEPSVRVTHVQTGESLAVMGQSYDQPHHFHTISVNGTMRLGEQYDVYIKYKGHLRDDMQGLFRSSYIDSAGDTRWLAATHFQPCRARRAFPSFDEPALKARFKVRIARTMDRRALTNMPVVNVSEPDPKFDSMIWEEFAETPMPLSTYLMAFIVSDFTNLTVDNYLSLWQRPAALSQAEYSASISLHILRTLESYTDLHFFLPKMDEVAVPDYMSGATEQWGLVTYRERLVLYVEGVSTSAHKQATALVIAHEFTHMWFGNLVSPKWWNYLWLSEGFAKYFEYFILAEVETDWRLEEQFTLACVRTAMVADAVNTSHPMTVEVADPVEISAIFDTISYQKAASVIRMMKHFLSLDTFRKGLTRYLTAVGNSSAEPDDLFSAMEEQLRQDNGASSIDVKTVMDTWTLQMGYPVLTVTRDYGSGRVTVSQERFLLRPAVSAVDTHDYSWWIPLTYTSRAEQDFQDTATKHWLQAGQRNTTLSMSANLTDWVVFNVQQVGFYRVNYDERNWRLVSAQLDSDDMAVIPALTRAQLLDDSLNLARAGLLDYTVALDLTRYLQREDDYLPWYSALSAFRFLDSRLQGETSANYQLMKDYVLKQLSHLYDSLGFEVQSTDDHVTKLLRRNVLSWACSLDHEDCVNTAVNIVANLRENPNSTVAGDVSHAVYCTALRHGGEAEWGWLWDRYKSSDVSSQKVGLLSALGCSVNPSVINRYLRLATSEDSGVLKQDVAGVFSAVCSSSQGVDLALDFLAGNYHNVSQFLGGADTVVSIVAASISTQQQADKLRNVLVAHAALLEDLLESVEDNLEWSRKYGAGIVSWLAGDTPPTTTETSTGGTGRLVSPLLAVYSATLVVGLLAR